MFSWGETSYGHMGALLCLTKEMEKRITNNNHLLNYPSFLCVYYVKLFFLNNGPNILISPVKDNFQMLLSFIYIPK